MAKHFFCCIWQPFRCYFHSISHPSIQSAIHSLSVHQSSHSFIHDPFIHPSIYPSSHSFIQPSSHSSIYPSIQPSVLPPCVPTVVQGASQLQQALEGEVGDVRGGRTSSLGALLAAPPAAHLLPERRLLLLGLHRLNPRSTFDQKGRLLEVTLSKGFTGLQATTTPKHLRKTSLNLRGRKPWEGRNPHNTCPQPWTALILWQEKHIFRVKLKNNVVRCVFPLL